MHAHTRGGLRGTSLMTLLSAALLITATACGPASTTRLAQTAPSTQQVVLDPETRLRQNIDQVASTFIGATYVYGAKGPSTFDCSGFTSHVLRNFDISLLGSSMSQAKQGRSIPIASAQPGDLVYFKNKSGRVNHVALVVANGQAGLEVIHATTSRGVVRDNVSESSYWSPRLAGARCVVDCRVGLAAAY